MNDAEAIRRAVGDPLAFEQVYRRHAPRLQRWVSSAVGSDDVALDIVAETFAQVLTSAQRFRGSDDASAAAWLDGISRNLVRRFIRRSRTERAARQRLGIDRDVTEILNSSHDDPQDDAFGSLAAAWRNLSVGERAAIELRVLNERPYSEIGKQLDARPEAVRARVSRGLRFLRAQLEGEVHE